jgi:hypothetical protein
MERWSADAVALTNAERKAAEDVVMLASTAQGRSELHAQLSWAAHQESGGDSGFLRNKRRKLLSDDSPATQGAGFKVPFYPKNSTVFDPLKSKTFRVVPKQVTRIIQLRD